MPRNPKKKRVPYPAETMELATKLCVVDGLTLRTSSERTGIPFQTLQRYVKKFKEIQGKVEFKPNYKSRTIFTEEMEAKLQKYLITASRMNYGLTLRDARELAYELARANEMNYPANWERDGMAGKEWMYLFMRRHPLSLRKPEGCSVARNMAFNKENVNQFFSNLKGVYEKYPTMKDGTRIYNLDETGVTNVGIPSRVIAAMGQHQVCQTQSAERGTLVTVCAIVSAAGVALPPAMIFPRANFVPRMTIGAPPGTLGLAAKSPWMTGELFELVLDHFITHSGSTVGNPTLLLMDNHRSHLAPGVLSKAKEHGVVLLTLPPHCTHKMQPLDVGVFGPFMTYYNQAIANFHVNNKNAKADIYNVASFVGFAHTNSMSIRTITNSFKKTGVFPYDDSVFNDDEFLPTLQGSSPEENSDQAAETLQTQNQHQLQTAPQDQPQQETDTPDGNPQPPQVTPDNLRPLVPKRKAAEAPKSNRKKQKSEVFTLSPSEAKTIPSCHGDSSVETGPLASKNLCVHDSQPSTSGIARKEGTKKGKAKKKLVPARVEDSSSSEDEDHLPLAKLLEKVTDSDDDYDESESKERGEVSIVDIESPCGEYDEGSYVLVAYEASGKQIYYVSKVLSKDGSQVEVSCLRKGNGFRFHMPPIPDINTVDKVQVKAVLKPPSSYGGTTRCKSHYQFEDLFPENLQIR